MSAQNARPNLAARARAMVAPVLARREAPLAAAPAQVPRQSQRVLQTGRAPAQLSLFLQPRYATAVNRIPVSRTNP